MEKLINENLTVYMKDVDMLRNIIRYNTAPKNNQETVAEHSFYVAAYVLKLHEFYEFDLEKALSLSLLHDFSEVYISDVPHPVKANNKALEDALESAEYEINKEKLSETVANWLVEFNNRTTAEGTICALADILSVVSYSKNEMSLILFSSSTHEISNSFLTLIYSLYAKESSDNKSSNSFFANLSNNDK